MQETEPGLELSPSSPPGDEEVWLLGQPLLRDYLSFVKGSVRGGETWSRAALIDEWRSANDYYQALAKSEAGLADTIECRDLDSTLAPLVASLMAEPRFRAAFDSVPARFGMVELDKLVMYQIQITRTFTNTLADRLGPNPDSETLFRFCQRLDSGEAAVRVQGMGSNCFAFESDSTDFGFQEALYFRPDQIPEGLKGGTTGVVGLAVGFGSNFLSVVHDDDSGRMVLHNGYHRAHALRAMGITHAPCLIKTVTRRDELDLCANSKVAKSPGYYFNAPRPPLLKDYFDPKIRKILPTRRIVRRIEVKFKVKEYWLSE